MSSIVRVKRRIDEEPLDALVLKTKRAKVEKDDSVFRFCGTLSGKDEEITSVKELLEKSKASVQNLRRDVKKKSAKTPATRVNEQKLRLTENRYRLINQLRDVPAEPDLQIYDLVPETKPAEDTITLNGVPLVVETVTQPSSEENYVYDIYMSESTKFDKSYLDSLLYIQPYTQEFYFGDRSDSEKEDYDEEDEDSNEEGNWRNEYPDTDEDFEDRDVDYGIDSKFDSWHLGESDDEDAYTSYKRRALQFDEDDEGSSD